MLKSEIEDDSQAGLPLESILTIGHGTIILL
jgi:hypothetical protein